MVQKIKKGSKISRLGRHIFEHKKIKTIFGTNLALMLFASSFLPQTSSIEFGPDVQTTISQETTIIKTERKVGFPVKKIKITQGYSLLHPGLDLDGLTGDYIYPVMPGVVAGVQYSKIAYGNAVLIDHGSNLVSLYAHLSKIEVKVGDKVETFTKIGEMGETGRASGDHLHLEIRDNGKPLNPLAILNLK